MPTLSIIIITHNSKEIIACLRSVYSNVTIPFETIVVDNDSHDDSVARIKETFPQTKIIANKINKGYGAACNQAITIAQGNYILILNPDILLEKNTIPELLKYAHENREARIISCTLKNSDGTVQDSFRTFPTILSLLKRQITTRFRTKRIIPNEVTMPQKVDWISGAFMLLKDRYYFDERFFLYFEDVDLCKTIGNVYYYPGTSATHLAKRESARNLKLTYWHAKSAVQYFFKHGFFST